MKVTFYHLNTRVHSEYIYYSEDDNVIDIEDIYRSLFDSLGKQKVMSYKAFRLFTEIKKIEI